MMATNLHNLAEQLLPYEREAFLWLNKFHTAFFDSFMWMYSGKIAWIPLVLVALFVFTYKTNWKQSLLLVCCLVLVGILCDQLASSVIRPLFERLRPTHHPDFRDYVTIVNNYRGGKFGFISAHAANGFGIATFSSLLFKYRRFTVIIFTWATLTCYSRIYLGVHFISDIVGGMLVGILVGVFVYMLFDYGRIRFLKQTQEEIQFAAYSPFRSNIISATIGLTVIILLIISIINII